jgi:hypothetical protein
MAVVVGGIWGGAGFRNDSFGTRASSIIGVFIAA